MRQRLLVVAISLAACGDDGPAMEMPMPTCGDGNVDVDLVEECDDGNADLEDGCELCKVVPIPTKQWVANVVISGVTDPLRIALTPRGVAVDAHGVIYAADTYRHRIYRVDASITVFAGNGVGTYGGDDGPARTAALNSPTDVAVDAAGNVFIADTGNNRIRKVDTGGTITTVAGTFDNGYNGDEIAATSAFLKVPSSVAVAADGTLYIADTLNHRIRNIDPTGVIHTFAGTGGDGFAGDDGPATDALLNAPLGVDVDEGGIVYIADSYNAVVRKVEGGMISTVAGNTILGSGGDGGPATMATLTTPTRVAVRGGSIYIADADAETVRKVDASGIISTIAGTGMSGFGGDGGPAASAVLAAPQGIDVDATGRVVIGDTQNFRVRAIDGAGTITTAIGTGEFDDAGDGGAPTGATLVFPRAVSMTATGDLYVADTDHHRVRKISAGGEMSTVAGTGQPGIGGDGGLAIAAQVTSPTGVALDAANNKLYISQPTMIRRVGPNGNISTLAMGLQFASGIAVDAAGNAYFTERDANVVKKIAAVGGAITIIAGDGTAAFGGDDGLASASQLKAPDGVSIDGTDIYIADTGNRRVRKIANGTMVDGTITTVVGDGSIVMGGITGDGGPATAASAYPYGVAVVGGVIYVADGLDYRIRKVVGGTITTIAGTGIEGITGDGALGTMAKVGFAHDIAADAAGNAYYADHGAFRVRKIDPAGTITTFAGRVDPPGVGALDSATLFDPRAIATVGDMLLVAGGVSGVVQAVRGTTLSTVAGRYQQDVPTANLARFRDASFGAVTGVAYDEAAGVVYMTETSSNRIQMIDLVDPLDANTWTIAPLANVAGTAGFTEGEAATARFSSPSGLWLDAAAKKLYVADTQNFAIRVIDLAMGPAMAMVSTIAGSPQTAGFGGDGGPAMAAGFDTPRALVGCPNGDIFVADTNNHRIRRIAATGGTISTVLGNGENLATGEGIPSTTIPAAGPRGLACDANNGLYVTTTQSVRYLPADATKHVVDGTGEVQTIFGRKRETFPASASFCLSGIQVNDGPMVRIVDSCAGTLVELRPQ